MTLRATLALSSGRYSASRTRTRELDGRRGRVGLGTHGDLDPAGDVADQPADGLPPRSVEVALGGVLAVHAPAPEVADQEGARRAPCRTAGPPGPGRSLPAGSRTSARTTAPGLMPPTRLSVWNGGIAASRFCSSSSVFRSPDPGLEPAFAGQDQAVLGIARPAGSGRFEVDRQQLADRRAVVLPLGERVGAAQHEQAAAALAHEVPQEGELVRGEERGLEVVEDDRVIAVELVGRLGEAVAQLDLVEGAEADQHRLVGPLGRSASGWSNPSKSGLVDRVRVARKSNFGCRRAIRTRPTSWTCSSSSRARRRNLNSQFGRPLT